MTIAGFNHLDTEQKRALLTKCCGATAWVNKMLEARFAKDLEDMEETAAEIWNACTQADWLEAFEHHPKIGDIQSLKEKYKNTAGWASKEQAEVDNASADILKQLAKANKEYEEKFGFIFIVCATGKSAGEMLQILLNRLPNNKNDEIQIAAEEQLKITKLRLEKLFL